MHAHHGNTPAAWTGVTIILAGFLVGGIGLIVAQPARLLDRRGAGAAGHDHRQGHAEDGAGSRPRRTMTP